MMNVEEVRNSLAPLGGHRQLRASVEMADGMHAFEVIGVLWGPSPDFATMVLSETEKPLVTTKAEVWKRVLEHAYAVGSNDGRLTGESSMDLDFAQDNLEKALDAWKDAV